MSATVLIYRWTGSGPGSTDITATNTRCNAEDSGSSTTGNGIQIPASSYNYSYVVWTRLHCSIAPATGINNLKWYTDGSNGFGTGVDCNVATGSSYTQATGTPGVTGTELNSLTSLTTADAFSKTSGSPLSVSGSIAATTGDFGDYVAFQFKVGSTASPGVTPQETFVFKYDES